MKPSWMILAWMVAVPAGLGGQEAPGAPASPPAATPTSGEEATVGTPAPTRPSRGSWTGDRTRLGPGDLVTVLVDEQTLATANRDEARIRDRDRNLGVNAGAGSGSGGFGVRTVNDERDRSFAETYRRDRLAAEVTARVVEVGPDGSLRLEGRRLLRIDDHDQELTVRGWIRPGDVGGGNTVASYRLADAEILYETNGSLGRSRSFLGRLLDRVWP